VKVERGVAGKGMPDNRFLRGLLIARSGDNQQE
jgi:hypothetical protein